MKFEDLPQAQKGRTAEFIVDGWIREIGWVPYRPIEGYAHPFDRLVASRDKKRLVIMDVKAKARRTWYPDTGINIKHFDEYSAISEKHKLPVFLAFVDEGLGKIYGEFLSRLIAPRSVQHLGEALQYPIRDRSIIYFPLIAMRDIKNLSGSDISALVKLSTRNEVYALPKSNVAGGYDDSATF